MKDPAKFATLTVAATSPRGASRHGPVQTVADDVFVVRGKMPSTPSRPWFERWFVYFSRTMTIVRQRKADGSFGLTLINTIRLGDDGLSQLAELGKIDNVVRLGAFHGIDDAFYIRTFGAKYFVVKGMQSAPGLEVSSEQMSESNLPIGGCQLFSFDRLRFPEAILILAPTASRPGVAITTDSIQNHQRVLLLDNSPLVSFAIWKIGLRGPARLGPLWMNEQAPGEGQENSRSARDAFFRPQFQRLLDEYDFDVLIPGHGEPMLKNAKVAIAASMEQQLRH